MLANISNKYIIELLFTYMRDIRKLIIIKYNKNLKERINMTNKDYEVYRNLVVFNKTYKTNIEDINIKELNLTRKRIKIDAISILNKIEFKDLKILNLSNNEVSNLSGLKSASFKNIEILNLEKN